VIPVSACDCAKVAIRSKRIAPQYPVAGRLPHRVRLVDGKCIASAFHRWIEFIISEGGSSILGE
jgi:hypothetical protein